MKNNFNIPNITGFIEFSEAVNNEGLEFVVFYCRDLDNSMRFSIVFNPQQFIGFLERYKISEVLDESVVIDFYVEDEEGVTCLETIALSVQDFVMNYISNNQIEEIIKHSLEEFRTQIL